MDNQLIIGIKFQKNIIVDMTNNLNITDKTIIVKKEVDDTIDYAHFHNQLYDDFLFLF